MEIVSRNIDYLFSYLKQNNLNMNKVILQAIVIIIGIYLGTWLFNHINAWLGIGFLIIEVLIILNYILNKIKQN